MAEKLKLFGALIVILLIAAAAYVLVYSFINLGSQEKSTVIINGWEIKAEIVKTPLTQARGLSGRDSIGDDEGMLFVFSKPKIQNFWMKGMKFPIDIIWVKDNTIIGFETNVSPEPGVSDKDLKIYSSPEPVDKVLEMKAGSVQNLNIKIGDKIEF